MRSVVVAAAANGERDHRRERGVDEVVGHEQRRVAEALDRARLLAHSVPRARGRRLHAEAELACRAHRASHSRRAEAERVALGGVELVDLVPLDLLDVLDHQLRDAVAALDGVRLGSGRC